MRRFNVVLVRAVLLVLFMAGVADSRVVAATLVVEVSNGTVGGSAIADDAVMLQVFRQQELQRVLEATLSESGRAVFEGVSAGPSMVAVARVKHQDMAFQSRPVSLASPENEYSVSVQVFDVSSETSELSVGTHHIMLSVQGTALEITEYMQLENGSDMAIRGSKRDSQGRPIVIEIALPRGVTNLTPLAYFERDALVDTETGFYDTMAVPPGEHHVRFSYRIDIARSATAIDKRISLPTSELIVFWQTGQGEVTGLGEPDERLTNAQGTPVEYYRRHDLRVGDQIAFRISGFNVKLSDKATWIVLAFAFALIITLALWRLRSGPKGPAPTGQFL